jgi:hypothetical protein
MTAADHYRTRAAECERRRQDGERQSLTLSRLRLVTFLAAVVLCVVGLGRRELIWFALGVAGFIAFGVLVVRHARVEEAIAICEARRVHNMRGLARRARAWDELPDVAAPSGLDLATHAYSADLDLFGHASLAKWLGPASTPAGASTLAAWLLNAADADEVARRQQAIDELSPRTLFRESLAAEGMLWRERASDDVSRFIAWAESAEPILPGGLGLHAMVLLLTAAIWILIGFNAAGVLLPVTIGVVLWFALGARIARAFSAMSLGVRGLTRYAAMLALASREPWTSPWLLRRQGQLHDEGRNASAALAILARILGFGELRSGAAILHFPIQAFTLWDFHVLHAVERWRARWGGSVRGWLEALGDIDALTVCSAVRHDHPDWAMPAIDPAADRIAAEAAGHPLIPDDRRVPNDVTVGPAGTLLLVTGSNMSGKSTLLRAIGLNVVLAQAGMPVCARAWRLPPADLRTSIRVEDSLELGLSYFMAALARLKAIVDAAQVRRDGRVLLYLLDEILQGTNSAERAIAVRAVARHLLDAGAIGAMTTHDLSIASEEPLASAAQLVHFTEQVAADGTMSFDYRLRPGLATSRNALRLMQLIGIQADPQRQP